MVAVSANTACATSVLVLKLVAVSANTACATSVLVLKPPLDAIIILPVLALNCIPDPAEILKTPVFVRTTFPLFLLTPIPVPILMLETYPPTIVVAVLAIAAKLALSASTA